MTVVLCEGGKTYIAQNFAGIEAYNINKATLTHPNNLGMWVCNSKNPQTIFHCDGEQRVINVYKDEINFKDEFTVKNIINSVLPAMKERAKNYDIINENHIPASFIIAQKGVAIHINEYSAVTLIENFYCSGKYKNIVYSSLADSEGEDAVKRICKAFYLAGAMNNELVFPIVVMDTESSECRYIYEEESYLN